MAMAITKVFGPQGSVFAAMTTVRHYTPTPNTYEFLVQSGFKCRVSNGTPLRAAKHQRNIYVAAWQSTGGISEQLINVSSLGLMLKQLNSRAIQRQNPSTAIWMRSPNTFCFRSLDIDID
jgi:hypothetical protein